MMDDHKHVHHSVARDQRAARNRRNDLESTVGRIPDPQPRATPRRLVQIYNGGSMPSQPNHVYLAHPVELDGVELSGGAATPTADSSQSLPVIVLGHAPLAGDLLTAHAVAGRWVAYRGATPVPSASLQIVGCSGPIAGIAVTISSSPTSTPFFSGSTNSNGMVDFNIASAGVYWVGTSYNGGFPLNRYAWGSKYLYLTAGLTVVAPGPISGYYCCSTMSFPLQSKLYLTVCNQTYTLNATGSSGSPAVYNTLPSIIQTAGVAEDSGTCNWSGFPNTVTGTTIWSIGLACPTSTTSMTGLISTSALGRYNAATGGYDGFTLSPSSCAPTNSCRTTSIQLTGTIGETISLTGVMPSVVPASCVDDLTPYALPCAGQTVTVTS